LNPGLTLQIQIADSNFKFQIRNQIAGFKLQDSDLQIADSGSDFEI